MNRVDVIGCYLGGCVYVSASERPESEGNSLCVEMMIC